MSVLMMCLCQLLLTVIPNFAQVRLTWPVLFIISACGFGASVLGGGWLEHFSRIRPGDGAAIFAGAAVVAGSCTIFAAHMNYFLGMIAVVVMPVASFFLLKKQITAAKQPDDGQPPAISLFNPFPPQLIVLFVLFYAAGGLMFKIIYLEQAYPYLFYLANSSYALVCFVAGMVLYYKPTTGLRSLVLPVLPFLGSGFILFAAKVEVALLPFLLLQAGFALFDMYTWLLIAYFARFHTRPAAVCCLGLFLITFSIFCGNLAFSIWTGFSHTSTGLLAMFAGIVCLLVIFVFPDRRETFSGWAENFAAPAQPKCVQNDSIPSDIPVNLPELTVREKEILLLLLKGRNNRLIAGMFDISVNTVKYHVRNLYEKLHVNNRQELLDLIEKIGKNEKL